MSLSEILFSDISTVIKNLTTRRKKKVTLIDGNGDFRETYPFIDKEYKQLAAHVFPTTKTGLVLLNPDGTTSGPSNYIKAWEWTDRLGVEKEGKLKPCPFCGVTPSGKMSQNNRSSLSGTDAIVCDFCKAIGPQSDKPEEAWDTRAILK